jgi:3-mercaptopyruvate sulfurtransferase SseA
VGRDAARYLDQRGGIPFKLDPGRMPSAIKIPWIITSEIRDAHTKQSP